MMVQTAISWDLQLGPSAQFGSFLFRNLDRPKNAVSVSSEIKWDAGKRGRRDGDEGHSDGEDFPSC